MLSLVASRKLAGGCKLVKPSASFEATMFEGTLNSRSSIANEFMTLARSAELFTATFATIGFIDGLVVCCVCAEWEDAAAEVLSTTVEIVLAVSSDSQPAVVVFFASLSSI